jgi:diguanylate cyclase (GGDEF)-like protein
MDLSPLLLREDIGESYDAVLRAAAAAVGAAVCHLALYDAENQELLSRRPRYTAPGEATPQYRFPVDSSPASALVVRTQAPHISNNPASDPLYDPSVVGSGVTSILTVPLLREGRLIGLVYALNRPEGFSPEDARTLQALASGMAITLENIRLYAEERDRRVFNESLLEVTRALVATPSEDAALGVALDQLWRVVRYHAAAALVLEGELLRVSAVRGAEAASEVPLAQAPVLTALLESRKPGVIDDPAAALQPFGFRGISGKAVVAPLVSRRDLFGGLIAVFDAEHSKDARETQLVSGFADQVTLFLDTGRLLRRERQARARAAAVARVTRMVATQVDPDSILKVAAAELLALSGADRCVLYLGHTRNPVLIPVANAGTLPEELGRVRDLRVDLTSSSVVRLAEEREPLVFQGEAAPPPDIVAFPETTGLALLPMVSRDVIMGAVALYVVGRRHQFDPVQLEFLQDVAQQTALALENARLFSAMSQMATTDELTRLANRRKFMEALQGEIQKARQASQPLALILADVDHLKRINDTFGHAAGDAAIRQVADVLRRDRRDNDVPARLGGEEFAVILPGTDILAGARVAERICELLAGTPVPAVGRVTASFGVATFPDDGAEAKDVLKTADERLYSAKASGRNQVCYVTLAKDVPESTTSSLKRVELPEPDEPTEQED